MSELSAKQRQILEYMKAEVREKGYPPSVREICDAVGLKSTSMPAHSAASDSLLGAAFSHKSEAHLFFRVALLRSNVPHFAKIRMGLRKD